MLSQPERFVKQLRQKTQFWPLALTFNLGYNAQMRPSLSLDSTQAQPAAASRSQLASGLVRLLAIGLATQLIYVIYIVAFPLVSNTHKGGPAADLEILMRGYRWFAPVYTAGIFLLYFLFWQALRTVSVISNQMSVVSNQRPDQGHSPSSTPHASRLTPHTLKLLILGFGLIFGFTLIWLYPITANDLFRYVLRGRIWAVYGESPMLSPPNNFPNDPYIAFAGEFGEWVSGYGPLWEIIVQVPLRLFGATDMVPGSLSLKLVVLLFYGLCAVLIGWFAKPRVTSFLTFTSSPSLASDSASTLALLFFAWNPLILMQGPGNGHNDMVFMALMVLGIVLWQRKLWWAATLALTLATLAKITSLLLLPLFAIVLLKSESSWRQRLLKALGAALIVLVTAYIVYRALGPLAPVFQDAWNVLTTRLNVVLKISPFLINAWAALSDWLGFVPLKADTPPGLGSMLTARRGFAIASGLRMVLREILPREASEPIARNTASYIFILFYLWLLIQLWRNKLTLITAGFLAYFSQLMLGATFRIWYPMWLIPLAALHLTPFTFWSTFLFSLTSELSIINYFVVWRWWLNNWSWGKTGPLSKYWNYWTIMHLLTIPWLFGIPLFGPILMRWRAQKLAQDSQ
ncbi:MAG: hypothetical protein Fur0044_01400 [Anaerolineae bacterium]